MSVRIARAARSTDAAYAPVAEPFSYEACTYWVSVCVWPAMLPPTIATAPNSPSERAIVSRTPSTTGESAIGRSTIAFTSPMPGMRCRTIASAQRTPKIVLSGTATSAISSVSFRAWTANGLEIAAQNGCHPCSNARQKISATGATRITARYASEVIRIEYLAIMAGRVAAERADSKQDTERDREQQHGERRRTWRVAAIEPLEHVQGCDLGLEWEVA